MSDNLIFQLGDVLRRHYERLGGSWNALALRIEETNAQHTNGAVSRVDRRKLKQLCGTDYEKVSLSIGELKAIDQYLLRHNQGLAEHPIFARLPDLLDAFLYSDQLHFFMAARAHEALGTDTISRWDLRAITRIIRSKVAPLDLKLWDTAAPEDWARTRQFAQNQAKIGVGSPIACVASEALLADMVNVEPFQATPLQALPFFLVRRDKDPKVQSAFVYTRKQAAKTLHQSVDQIPSNRRAIALAGELFTPTTQMEDYGLLVAQRHPKEKQLHMVLCGLSGPATYGLAKALQKGMVQARPPGLADDKHPPILAAIFRVSIELDDRPKSHKLTAEIRRRPKPELVAPIREFHYIDGRWQEHE